MPELTDAQKVNREVTQKRIATALESIASAQPRPNGLPAGGTDGDVLVKNGATDYAAKWTSTPKQMGSLATIEPTSSASKAYAAGDYLVYNGQLYKVTATSISQGQTLNPGQGGNIKAVDVATDFATNDDVASKYNKHGGNNFTIAENLTDLTAYFRNHSVALSIATYRYNAVDVPSTNTGIVFTMGDGPYRLQYAIDIYGDSFARSYANGTISAWTQK